MDGLIALFLFPAFAGYIVLTRTKLYSIRTHTFSMPRLFAESAVIGIGLLYLSSFLIWSAQGDWTLPDMTVRGIIDCLWQGLIWPIRNELNYATSQTASGLSLMPVSVRAHLTDEAILAVMIAWLYSGIAHMLASGMGQPLNHQTKCIAGKWLYRRIDNQIQRHENRILRERDKHGGSIERFFALSMNSVTPVQITMKNRKVYVGLIQELPPLSPQNKQQRFVNIFPLLSGYRDSESLALSKDVTDYDVITDLLVLMQGMSPADSQYAKKLQDILDNMDPTLRDHLDMGIAIDADEIVTVSLWDGAVSKHFESVRNATQQKKGSGKKKP